MLTVGVSEKFTLYYNSKALSLTDNATDAAEWAELGRTGGLNDGFWLSIQLGFELLKRQVGSSASDPDVKWRKPSYIIIFSMGHVGASRRFPSDAPWEILSQFLHHSWQLFCHGDTKKTRKVFTISHTESFFIVSPIENVSLWVVHGVPGEKGTL